VNFSSEKISSELFEVGSEQRLSILLNLKEKKWTISALAKEIGSTVTEVHRNFGRLQKAGLILKESDGTFRLTVRGENICSQIPSIAFVLENSKFFESHNFGKIPLKFKQRIGALNKCKHVKGVVRVLEVWKQIHSNSNQYIYNVLTEVPYSKEIIDVVEDKLNKKIKIRSVFAVNAIIPEERTSVFKIKNFTKFIQDNLLERRMIDHVDAVVLLNEKEACVIFPNLNGEPDMSEMFYSDDPEFHEWSLDYFEYCWSISTSFQESKLSKV